MIRQVFNGRGQTSSSLVCLFRQMHVGSAKGSLDGTSQMPGSFFLNHREMPTVAAVKLGNLQFSQLPKLAQTRQGILEMPMQFIIRPSIGIPPEMLRHSEYRTPVSPNILPLQNPTINGNINKEIRDSPNNPGNIEKQAARLIVIRRAKMNKHKLRKLRKKMKYIWAKIRLRRAIRKEKAYLNSKMDLINDAKKFDAKEYVAGIIKRAKEEPIPRKWTDPLMPEWFKEQEMKKEAWQKRYQKMINLYLNKSITIDFKEKRK